MQKIIVFFILVGTLLISGCALTPQPHSTRNLCKIFAQYPDWRKAAIKAERRWKIPTSVNMSIIRSESAFIADAKPPRRKILWLFPSWNRLSSAYGYSQALDGTWDEYRKQTHHYFANRDEFADAIDFVGWYNHQAAMVLKINPKDAYHLYLAYHEGIPAYRRGYYRRHRALKRVAKETETFARLFAKQLQHCRKKSLYLS